MCLRWWRDWRDFRALPYHGDVLDQPIYVVDAIRSCEAEHTEATTAADEAARKELEEHGKRR